MKTLRLIYRGCGYLPKYGNHPGTGYAIAFPLLGAAAGGWFGFFAMSAFFLPLYFYGAYERAKESDAENLDTSRRTL